MSGRFSLSIRIRLIAGTLLLSGMLLHPLVQAQPLPRNPFAGFETHVLDNGLKLWFKPTPGEPNVAMNVVVAVGRDDDPPGKEQLTHFLEHMLFSEHDGRTTEEIKHEIEDRGGQFNGMTAADRSTYYVNIGVEHGLFALDWLYKVVSPHVMDPAVVDRERQPVALEIGARPRSIADWVRALYLRPPWLRFGGLWERQFGLETNLQRDVDQYRSLNSITPEDLREHYEHNYRPGRMTLTVIGDLDREEVIEAVTARFGTLEGGPLEAAPEPYELQETFVREHYFDFRPTVYMRRGWRLDAVSAEDSMMLDFISRILRIRLSDELRFGELKAAYSVGVGFVHRGPVGFFTVSGNFDPEDIGETVRIIDTGISELRDGTMDPVEFRTHRTSVVEQLRVSVETPAQLGSFAYSVPWDRSRFVDVPDLLTTFSSIELADVSAFLSARFVETRESLYTFSPPPIPEWLAVVLLLAVFLATVRIVRRLTIRPVDMARIRYVARIRIPWLYALVAGMLGIGLLAVALRLLLHVYEWIRLTAVVRIESFWLQYSIYTLMGISLLVIVMRALGRIPAKALVFDDRLLIKSRSYRSVAIPLDEIESLAVMRLPELWRSGSGRLRGLRPFKLGLLSPGVYLRQRGGRGYFFDVRDRDELTRLLRGLRPDTPGDSADVPVTNSRSVASQVR